MKVISGRVLSNFRTGKHKNTLLIASSQYGRAIVRATLSNEDADGISWNDYVQLSGEPRRRTRTAPDGSRVREVLIMNPSVDRRIHMTKMYKKG